MLAQRRKGWRGLSSWAPGIVVGGILGRWRGVEALKGLKSIRQGVSSNGRWLTSQELPSFGGVVTGRHKLVQSGLTGLYSSWGPSHVAAGSSRGGSRSFPALGSCLHSLCSGCFHLSQASKARHSVLNAMLLVLSAASPFPCYMSLQMAMGPAPNIKSPIFQLQLHCTCRHIPVEEHDH